jgi:hypothetical protein
LNEFWGFWRAFFTHKEFNSFLSSRYCVHVKFVWLSWKLERTSLRMFLIHYEKNRLLAEANFEISKFLDLQKFCKFELKFHPMEWFTGCVLTWFIWEYHWKKSFEQDQSCHRSPTLLPVLTHIQVLDVTISWFLNMTHWLGPLDVSWPGTYGNTIQNIHLIKTNPVTDHPPCFLSELTFRFWMSLWAGFQICPIVMK